MMSNTTLRLLLAVVLLALLAPVHASEFQKNVEGFKEKVKYVVHEIKVALQSIDLYRTPRFPGRLRRS